MSKEKKGKGDTYIEMGVPEASPDTITCLDVEGREGTALGNLRIDGCGSP